MNSILQRLAFRQSFLIRQCNVSHPVWSVSVLPSNLYATSSKSLSTSVLVEDIIGDPLTQEPSFPLRRFEELKLHPKSLKALRRQGLHKLTEIQEKSFDIILSGKDVVGRARTGTGKTLSFLLPSLERVLQKLEKSNLQPGISILILSPTRELAAQISKEADRLVAQHGSEITSQVVYGGSSRFEDIERFERQLPTVLVATPGRLKDHLATTKLNGTRPFIDTLQNLQVLVLDETDRLLDMGFRRDITDILSCLPRKRQTLLFSATIPQDVRDVVQIAIKSDYEMVDCIQDEDPATQTNAQIEQSYLVLPTEQFWTKSLEYLLDLVDKGDNKVMVFFPMTSMVELYAQIFNMRFGRRVLELHGRMHQRERTTVSRRFRNASKGILFTSDVSARGVDYPNVTHVVQIGASGSRETYIHRLGRTGRAGKRGTGLLILPQLEKGFLRELEGLEISIHSELKDQWISMPVSKKLMNELGPMVQNIRKGRDSTLEKSVHDAYQAMISYYFQRSSDKQEAVATVNGLADTMGLRELPSIELKRARRLGLDGIPDLNIQSSWNDQSWSTGWGEEAVTSIPSRPGQPYGDFDGSFGWDDRPQKKYHSDREEVKRSQPQQNVSDGRSSWQTKGSGRSDTGPPNQNKYHSNRGEERRSESRQDTSGRRALWHKHDKRNESRMPDQHTKAFARVGWTKVENDDFPGKPAFAKKKSKARFERWEMPGKFSFKGK